MNCIEYTPLAKAGGGLKKNMALGARFQKLRGALLSGRVEFSEGQGRAKFSEGARFLRATMFFCKHMNYYSLGWCLF